MKKQLTRVTQDDVYAAYMDRGAAKQAMDAATVAFNAACDAAQAGGAKWQDVKDDAAIVAALDASTEADAAYRRAVAVVSAMEYVASAQFENVVRRAIVENAEALEGLRIDYKRTKAKIANIIADACDIEPDAISIWADSWGNARGRVTILFQNYDVNLDGIAGAFDLTITNADTLRSRFSPRPGVDKLTPASVRKLAISRLDAVEQLRKDADAYRARVHKIIDRYKVIGAPSDLEKAAAVPYV